MQEVLQMLEGLNQKKTMQFVALFQEYFNMILER
jgi:hypothetical protein